MVKHSKSTGCPVDWLCWQMDVGALRCSLNLSLKVLPNSPMYCSGQSVCEHLYQYVTPFSLHMLSLSLGAMGRVCMVLLALKYTCMPVCLNYCCVRQCGTRFYILISLGAIVLFIIFSHQAYTSTHLQVHCSSLTYVELLLLCIIYNYNRPNIFIWIFIYNTTAQ